LKFNKNRNGGIARHLSPQRSGCLAFRIYTLSLPILDKPGASLPKHLQLNVSSYVT